MIPKRTLLAAACLAALPLWASAEEAPTAAPEVTIDRTTERVLLDACAYLRSAERFSLHAEVDIDEVLASGQKVQYSRDGFVMLERPNRLRAESASDKGVRELVYDGQTVTVFRPDSGVYAVFPAPETIDTMLDALEDKGVVLPLDDLLRTQPCAAIGGHLKTGTYAGRHWLNGDWYHHLLLTTEAVDVQMWVALGNEPEIRKVVITYRDAPGMPQYSAVLTDWDFAPEIDASTFTFSPPEGAKQVAFRGANESAGGSKQ
ncbi:MAG: DUF2092 domain-containing protein [Chromatiaceae bacterium]|nr:DUF2092 domain-containing protein [Chromatiaceae bacterium]